MTSGTIWLVTGTRVSALGLLAPCALSADTCLRTGRRGVISLSSWSWKAWPRCLLSTGGFRTFRDHGDKRGGTFRVLCSQFTRGRSALRLSKAAPGWARGGLQAAPGRV